MTKSQPQCIIMPLRQRFSHDPGFVGMALHFLLGNVMVLNSSLTELWFGWRVKKLFADADELVSYCRKQDHPFSIRSVNTQQNVRFWIYGDVDAETVRLFLRDTLTDKTVSLTTRFSILDHFVDFRQAVVNWTATNGFLWTDQEKEAILWPETCHMDGLDSIGKALLEFYLFSSFGHTEKISLKIFETAVKRAPDAFMSHDLLGWAYYRDQQFSSAAASFNTALSINPGGAGVMSGLMWCGIMTQDEDAALHWARKKAAVCGKNIEASREKAIRLYQKQHHKDPV